METHEDQPRILIVDDTRRNVQLLGNILKKKYKINVAENGLKAIEILKKITPDLILMDVMMPGIDGFETCRQIKQCHEYKDIPVIFLTAKNMSDDIVKGFESGGVDYIAKPFNSHELLARVNTHLDLRFKTLALKSLSELDGLTGIPNRRRFQTFFWDEWGRCRRSMTPLALLMIDIDCFKSFNDTYGHLAGDDCLRKVAQTISGLIKRPGDLAARYGGEEFAVVLNGTDYENSFKIAEQMCRGVQDLKIIHEPSEVSDYVSISVGTGFLQPSEHNAPEDLIQTADSKLYQAKNNGRNQVC